MNKLLYVPVLSIMETRKRFIDDNYRIAEENNAKSSELSKEKDEKLSEAKDVAKAQYNKTVDGFKTQRAEIIANAQNSAKDEITAFASSNCPETSKIPGKAINVSLPQLSLNQGSPAQIPRCLFPVTKSQPENKAQ